LEFQRRAELEGGERDYKISTTKKEREKRKKESGKKCETRRGRTTQ